MYQDKDQQSRWDAISDYDKQWFLDHAESEANLQVLVDLLGVVRGKRVIEVGCGSGLTSLWLAMRGARTCLLDFSPVALDCARRNYEEAGLVPDHCYAEDALSSTVPSDTFDLAFNIGVLEHFYDEGKVKLVGEMLRMVRPGGVVVVIVPNSKCTPFIVVKTLLFAFNRWNCGYEDDMPPERLLEYFSAAGIRSGVAYAYNPVSGWYWIPIVRDIIKAVGWDNVSNNMRRHPRGHFSIVVARKA